MPWRLLRFALNTQHPEPRMFRHHPTLKPSYDVVIIGAGGHGLAAAYYLARDHGIAGELAQQDAVEAAVVAAERGVCSGLQPFDLPPGRPRLF